MSILNQINDSITDLLARRNVSSGGAVSPHNAIEYFGGIMVPILPYEPDPVTFREQYYYNSTLNMLFTKAGTTDNAKVCKTRVFWARARTRQSL